MSVAAVNALPNATAVEDATDITSYLLNHLKNLQPSFTKGSCAMPMGERQAIVISAANN